MQLLAMRSPEFFSDSVSAGLFENHWTLWLAVAALAGLVAFVGRARANRQLFAVGLAVVGLVAFWVLLAQIVDSPAERLHAAHLDLAEAVKAGDVDRIMNHVSPTFTAPQLGITLSEKAKDEITAQIKEQGIKDAQILHYSSTVTQGMGFTDITMLTESGGMVGKMLTTWQLSWDDVKGEDWKIVKAVLTKIGDQPVGADFRVR